MNAAKENYPESLEVLGEGVKVNGQGTEGEKNIRFLRRIPKDPISKTAAWGGQNVFAVFSKTMEKAADGTPYTEW